MGDRRDLATCRMSGRVWPNAIREGHESALCQTRVIGLWRCQPLASEILYDGTSPIQGLYLLHRLRANWPDSLLW